MNTIPTPWQYFLDVLCLKRIEDTQKENNPLKLEKVMGYYADLKEDEVVFSAPVYREKRLKPSASYWTVSYVCRGRGYRRDDITFRALPIEPMLNGKAEIASSDLKEIKKEGFYFDRVTGQYHLLISKEMNLWEALKLTGYRFDPSFYSFTEFDDYHGNLNAHGFVKVQYPFLEGRIFINYLVEEPKVEPVVEVQEEPPVVAETEPTVEEQEEVVETSDETPVAPKPYQSFKKKR